MVCTLPAISLKLFETDDSEIYPKVLCFDSQFLVNTSRWSNQYLNVISNEHYLCLQLELRPTGTLLRQKSSSFRGIKTPPPQSQNFHYKSISRSITNIPAPRKTSFHFPDWFLPIYQWLFWCRVVTCGEELYLTRDGSTWLDILQMLPHIWTNHCLAPLKMLQNAHTGPFVGCFTISHRYSESGHYIWLLPCPLSSYPSPLKYYFTISQFVSLYMLTAKFLK